MYKVYFKNGSSKYVDLKLSIKMKEYLKQLTLKR
ncbi:TPA: MAP domain-containing protein [Staphylococcus aureus]|nr:MAP domain-containing protein [Staphylococcus aureus]